MKKNLKAGYYNLGGKDGSFDSFVESVVDAENAGHRVQFFTDQLGGDLDPDVSREVLGAGARGSSGTSRLPERPAMGLADPVPVIGAAGARTESMELFLGAIDPVRHQPTKLALTFLTLDNASKGRGFYALGAGEMKQLHNYGFKDARKGIFRRLEEAMMVIRMLFDSHGEAVHYEGEFFELDGGRLPINPYGEDYPRILAAPAPNKEIHGRWGDGMLTNITPGRHPIKKFREDVKAIREASERAGRDPDRLYIAACSHVILHDDPAEIDRIAGTPRAKWLTFSRGVNRAANFREFGFEPPIEDSWGYSNKGWEGSLDARQLQAAIDNVTLEMTKTVGFINGTPEEAVAYYEEYADAGLTHVAIVPYATLGLPEYAQVNAEMCSRLIGELQGAPVSTF